MDPGMNQLLKWSLENTTAASSDPTSTTDPKATRPSGQPLNPSALNTLFGGPTDAELMKSSMSAITSPEISLDNKLIAFDNFEQLIENIDNANNLQSTGLWTPLVGLLDDNNDTEEPELRRYAAWCCGTAVQNNVKAQERLLVMGAIPQLMKLAVGDGHEGVRRKALYALSSEVRNYQPALDEAVRVVPEGVWKGGEVDAGDMEAVDRFVGALREEGGRQNS